MEIDFYHQKIETHLELPLAGSKISAGFPSPADDFLEIGLDLNRDLIQHPSSTFYGRVKGSSMQDEGIFDGDILIIDKSIQPKNGDIAVCFIDGEFTLKKIKLEQKKLFLMPANPAYKPIEVKSSSDFSVWGIVTYTIHKHI